MKSLGSWECHSDFEIFPFYNLIIFNSLEHYNKRGICYVGKLLKVTMLPKYQQSSKQRILVESYILKCISTICYDPILFNRWIIRYKSLNSSEAHFTPLKYVGNIKTHLLKNLSKNCKRLCNIYYICMYMYTCIYVHTYIWYLYYFCIGFVFRKKFTLSLQYPIHIPNIGSFHPSYGISINSIL